MNICKILITALLSTMLATANAASVSLVYTGGNAISDDGDIVAAIGDMLSFDLVMDFTDRITLGGGFDVNWDSSVFALDSYISSGFGDHAFGRNPVFEDGRVYNGAVGDFNGLTYGIIAFLSFEVIGDPTPTTNSITPSGTTGDSGPWIDGVTFVDIIDDVEYHGASVLVPVPAALWFLLSGVGLLVGIGRRRASV